MASASHASKGSVVWVEVVVPGGVVSVSVAEVSGAGWVVPQPRPSAAIPSAPWWSRHLRFGFWRSSAEWVIAFTSVSGRRRLAGAEWLGRSFGAPVDVSMDLIGSVAHPEGSGDTVR